MVAEGSGRPELARQPISKLPETFLSLQGISIAERRFRRGADLTPPENGSPAERRTNRGQKRIALSGRRVVERGRAASALRRAEIFEKKIIQRNSDSLFLLFYHLRETNARFEYSPFLVFALLFILTLTFSTKL